MQAPDRKTVIEIAAIFFVFSYIIGITKAVHWGLTFEVLTRFSFQDHLSLIGVGMYRTVMIMSFIYLVRVFIDDVKETRSKR